MIVGTAIACIAAGVWAFSALHVARAGAEAVATARSAVAQLSEPGVDDDLRERATRRSSLALFKMSASIALRSSLSVLVAILPALMADQIGVAGAGDVLQFLSRWDVVGVTTAGLAASYVVRKKWPRA